MASSKKKIIIIGPVYPYRGGNALFVTHTYEALKNHFDVKIYNYKLLYPSFLFPGTTQYDKSEQQVFKVPNERILNSINPYNWISTATRLINEKADLIIFDWWHPFFGFCHGTVSFLIKKKYRNKILFITENVVSHEANQVDKFLTKIGLMNSSKFLTLSEIVEKEVQQFSKGKKIYRSELPVYDCYKTESNLKNSDKLKEVFGFEEDSSVLLFFGYVRKYKGLDILIEAFPKILEVNPKARLLIVGEFYDNPQYYFDLIDKLGIKDKTKVINKFVPNEEVEKYYSVADVVVLPYRSATQSGILNVAYGFNKPVIVTNVGGLAEFVDEGKTGFVVAPAPEAIVEGVKQYLLLKEKTDFAQFIFERNKLNSFDLLPSVINKIIEESI